MHENMEATEIASTPRDTHQGRDKIQESILSSPIPESSAVSVAFFPLPWTKQLPAYTVTWPMLSIADQGTEWMRGLPDRLGQTHELKI